MSVVLDIIKRCLSYEDEPEWFNYQKDVNHEPFQHYLSRNITPSIYFHFDEDNIDGNRVVVLTIPAARIVPTEFKEIRYIRIGSSKEKLKRFPDREAALFKKLLENNNPTDNWETGLSKYNVSDIDKEAFGEYLRKAKEAERITFKSVSPKQCSQSLNTQRMTGFLMPEWHSLWIVVLMSFRWRSLPQMRD